MNSDEGFTLIEMILAVTILAIVVGIVLESFFIISRIWEKGGDLAEDRQMKRVAVESIATQLKSLYPFNDKVDDVRISWFFGGPDTVSFLSTTTFFTTKEKDPGLYLATYFVDSSEESGSRGLVLKQDYPPGIRLEEGASADSLILDENVIGLKFNYYASDYNMDGEREGVWEPSWDPFPDEETFSTRSFPEMVEFSLGYRGAGEEDTLWIPSVKVSIPAAVPPLRKSTSYSGFLLEEELSF